MKRQKINPLMYPRIIEYYSKGMSPRKIGRMFGITRQWVRKLAMKHDPLARHHRRMACQRLRLKNPPLRSQYTSTLETLRTSARTTNEQ